jgi:hypothetical protein
MNTTKMGQKRFKRKIQHTHTLSEYIDVKSAPTDGST